MNKKYCGFNFLNIMLMSCTFIYSPISLTTECKALEQSLKFNLEFDKLIKTNLDVDFIQKQNGKSSKEDGPNCVWSTLKSLKIVNSNVEFHYPPTLLSKQIASCFIEVKDAQNADAVIYNDAQGELFHIATVIDSNTVFSKNGLQKSVPYKIQTFKEMQKFYAEAHPDFIMRPKFFKFQPEEKCFLKSINEKIAAIDEALERQRKSVSDIYQFLEFAENLIEKNRLEKDDAHADVLNSFINGYISQKIDKTDRYHEFYLDKHIKKMELLKDFSKSKKLFLELDKINNEIGQALKAMPEFTTIKFDLIKPFQGYHWPTIEGNELQNNFCILKNESISKKDEDHLKKIQSELDKKKIVVQGYNLRLLAKFCMEN